MKKVIQIGLLVLCVGLMPKIAQAEVNNNNTNYTSASETIRVALTAEQEFEQLKPFLALAYSPTEDRTNAMSIGIKSGTTGTKLGDYTGVTVDENGCVIKIDWSHIILAGALDLSNFSKLTSLNCLGRSESKLTSLGVSNLTALTDLNCSENKLTSLDVSTLTALTDLSCYDNQLESLDVSNLTALKNLSCERNQLTILDVSEATALAKLICNNNKLTNLDVSNLTALTKLTCYNNQLISLNVSGATSLTNLDCSKNQIISLDVSTLTALINLLCYENQLISLDISNPIALEYLHCYSNQLTSLDVSGATVLKFFDCGYNQITSLDASGTTALREWGYTNNKLNMSEIKKVKISSDLFYDSLQNILGKKLDNSNYYIAPKGDIKSLGTDSSTYKWSDGTIGSNYDFSNKIGDTISCTITDAKINLKTNDVIIAGPIWDQMELEEAITKSKQILANENSTAEQIIDAMKDLADAIKNYEGDKNIFK